MATKKNIAARGKRIMAKAKKIRAKHPGMKWQNCVKKAAKSDISTKVKY